MKRIFLVFFALQFLQHAALYSQTITTGVVTGSPFCAGVAISIPYTKTGTFNTGNVFTAQLSDAAGSFANPLVIGTLTSRNSGTIASMLPDTLSSGTGYRIRVVSSSPVRIGTINNSNLVINATGIPIVTIASNASSAGNCGINVITFIAKNTKGVINPVYAWYKNNIMVGSNDAVYSDSLWNDKDSVYCVLTTNAPCLSVNTDTSNVIVLNINNANGSPWRRRNDISIPVVRREGAASFAIAGKGYVVAGSLGNEVWQYNPETDHWTQKSNFPGAGRSYAVGFAIGNKGYVGLGGYNDFWEYDPSTDNWIQLADFPGTNTNNTGFAIGNKGYVSSGTSFWEYDPANNTWAAKPSIPSPQQIIDGFGFSIGDKGYVGGGHYYELIWIGGPFGAVYNYVFKKDFYEYEPSLESWVRKADLITSDSAALYGSTPGFNKASTFSINDKGYVCFGRGFNTVRGSYPAHCTSEEYDQGNNRWLKITNFDSGSLSCVGGGPRYGAFGFSVNNKGYVGGGIESYSNRRTTFDSTYNDVWEYENFLKTESFTHAYCPGDTVHLNFNTGCNQFNSGNVFTAMISDSKGSFADSVVIGNAIGTGSGQISCILPFGLPSSSQYKVRVVSSSPLYYGTNTPIQINPIVTPISISGNINANGCTSTQKKYTVEDAATATYLWSVSGAGNSILSGQGTHEAYVDIVGAGTISVNASINNVCGFTSASASFDVINIQPSTPTAIKKSFFPDRDADVNISPYIISKVTFTQIADTFRVRKLPAEKTYLWEAPAGSVVNQINDTTIAVSFADSLVITPSNPQYIRVSAATECAISAPYQLELKRYFDCPSGTKDTMICRGQSVTLFAAIDTATTMKDKDGNVYPIVRIGDQVWMAKNLNVNAPQSYFYNDDPANGEIYGRLYQNISNVAPDGWHIPNMQEIYALENAIGGIDQGGKLKEAGTQHWLDPNLNATNETGFNALPGGSYYGYYINQTGAWWTRDKDSFELHQGIGDYIRIYKLFALEYSTGDIGYWRYYDYETGAFSVRCLRNLSNKPKYLWSTGDTTASINVNPSVSTTYYCMISDGLGYVMDTIKVDVSTTPPSAPGLITGPTDVCYANGAAIRYYIRKVSNAVSYQWTLPAGANFISGQGDTSIMVSFSGSYTSGTITVKSINGCGISAARSLAVYKRVASMPSLIQKDFFPSIAAVTSVCGRNNEIYKIRKVAYATGYDWSMRLGTYATIVHLNAPGINDTAVSITFLNGFTKDTLSVKATTACSVSSPKTIAISSLSAPPAVTGISGTLTPCIGNSFIYTATSASPTSTQSAIAYYRWTKPNNTIITSSNADSSSITLSFNNGFTGGSISSRGQSACGILGTAKSITLQYLTPTPTSISSSTGSYNGCIGSKTVFTVIVPTASTSQRAASVFRWIIPANTLITSASTDSSSIELLFNTGFSGGTLSVKGQTACGITGASKSQVLTHLSCPAGTKVHYVSEKNNQESNFEIYPNPSSKSFYINLSGSGIQPLPEYIKIMDAQGKMLKAFRPTSLPISFGESLPSGIYWIQIQTSKNIQLLKAVKR